MKDKKHNLLDIPVELPEFDKPPLEKPSFEEKLETIGFKKNSNGEYDFDGDVYLDKFPELVINGKLAIKFGKVGGTFSCAGCNNLTSLEGCPREVGRHFSCSFCHNLTSLIGAPEKVGRDFACDYCENLTSLIGAPEKVGRNFDCSLCEKLTNLEGAPRKVVGVFSCSNCKTLASLEGAPREVGRNFYCSNCGIKFTEDDVKERCKVSGTIKV